MAAERDLLVEPRAGTVGTDNHDLLFGVPALQLPQVPLAATMPAAIPEIPFAKRRDQCGIAKVAVFAYRRETGEPVWQSGIVINKSTANDIWVLGAGPFERGTIYEAAQFAGKKLGGEEEDEPDSRSRVASGRNTRFAAPTPYTVATNAAAIPGPIPTVASKCCITRISPSTAPTIPSVGA